MPCYLGYIFLENVCYARIKPKTNSSQVETCFAVNLFLILILIRMRLNLNVIEIFKELETTSTPLSTLNNGSEGNGQKQRSWLHLSVLSLMTRSPFLHPVPVTAYQGRGGTGGGTGCRCSRQVANGRFWMTNFPRKCMSLACREMTGSDFIFRDSNSSETYSWPGLRFIFFPFLLSKALFDTLFHEVQYEQKLPHLPFCTFLSRDSFSWIGLGLFVPLQRNTNTKTI